MENESIKINKLNGYENWQKWKFQITIILKSYDSLFSVIDGSYKYPTVIIKLDKESNADSQLRLTQAQQKWRMMDAKAQRFIVTSVDEQSLDYIMNCDTAKGMWEKLLSIYEQKSDTSITLVQQKFYSYVMDINDNIAQHISKLENLSRKLAQLGEPISDSMLMTKILMTLPENYKHFYSAWDSIPNENKTLSNLTSRLMVEETRHGQTQVQQNIAENSAFSAKKSFGTQKQEYSKLDNYSGNQQKPGKCNYCKKAGHWKRDCRILKKDKNKNESNSRSALIGVNTKISKFNDSDKWYVDTGVSDHMTSKR